ncbi:malonyl-CoA decarboxylase [Rhodopila globiformis]|uniref:Malonyl-CoA decarboxylase n=1 Tax=Rhodopila globiformis TaxID=1071 RepID=A0A2S6N055_RHOGL|nr:malonyl-CoA decarboxylase [Rhodopila globiformis]PPQ27978.1 malonyl-CoA decarboxylase [Rhodopila globiformis]
MSEAVSTGLLDRTIRRITGVWRDMAASVSGEVDESLQAQMRTCLAGRGGEISARNRAAKLAETYLEADDAGRQDFLRTLASFDSDPDTVAAAYQRVTAAGDPAERASAKAALRHALEPPRLRLLTQFASIPDGCKFLVDLRADLLTLRASDKMLAALDSDLRGLLASWFDIGFLELQRIDWNSPAALLEKLVTYEAVHAIRSWRDLKNRLDCDRRCYAFFHPRMPGEPLIFVEVALVKGLAASVQALLDEKAPMLDPRVADTAIFYSISNCQTGLSGISFGNFLIKRVVEELSAEFRNLKTFATLSPIPGFRLWLHTQLASNPPDLLSEDESASLVSAYAADSGAEALASIIAQRHWWRDPALRKAAEPVVVRLGARYLLVESSRNRARDPVAHFHLSNGARVERLNMAGDTSDKGAKESATLMVNYLYDPARIEEWHEDYAGEGKRNASTAVRKLARGWN